MQLLGVVVAAWEGNSGLADTITELGGGRAMQSLPYSLPSLLKAELWRSSRPAVCNQLCHVLALTPSNGSTHNIASACLLALRNTAEFSSWDVVSRHIACIGHILPAL